MSNILSLLTDIKYFVTTDYPILSEGYIFESMSELNQIYHQNLDLFCNMDLGLGYCFEKRKTCF